MTSQTRQRDRRPVDAAHEQTAQDDRVELGVRTPGQVSVQLSTKVEVRKLTHDNNFTETTHVLLITLHTIRLATYFYKQSQVHILRFYFGAPNFPVVFMVDVDTLKSTKRHILNPLLSRGNTLNFHNTSFSLRFLWI